jgi:molybdopterin-containing oxidoreductase family iron-sulfur binding subunit
MRGVMEKCTFCLQRIEQAKIAQKIRAGASDQIQLSEKDNSIPKTACQQVCPAGAIVFGDLSDPSSTVSRIKADVRNYQVFDSLGLKPRLTYLTKITNPNPDLPGQKGAA